MARKKYFLIVDTETTQTEQVADLGLVLCDRQGNVVQTWGLMIAETYTQREEHPLFHIFGDANDIFSKESLPKRYAEYDAMIKDGRRMVAGVAAVNRLLAGINAKYSPTLTAYNLQFDAGKLANTGIDITHFEKRFCLWRAFFKGFGQTKKYRTFLLEHGYFNPRTKHGNMSYQTKADAAAKFFLGADLPDEPHTALEDARDYELPILKEVVKRMKVEDYMNAPAVSWRNVQVKDWYVAK